MARIPRPTQLVALAGVFLFGWFASLQTNDPDAHLWISIYTTAAIICYLAFRQKAKRAGLVLASLFSLGFGAYQMTHVSTLSLEDEAMRETLGLLMVAATFALLWRSAPSR